ncbi:MAG TPA: sensor histidine kinase [Methanocella sp.]|nr:sensor histidine kinase [Methanocella sp.]
MALLASIRFQAFILISLIVVVPVVIVGGAGILYYRDVIKHNIWDSNMAEAKSISRFTANYVDLALTYIKSVADRSSLSKALCERNTEFLDFEARYIVNQSNQIDSAFFTDKSGTVLSSYPYTQIVGQSYLDRPYVGEVLNTSRPVVGNAQRSDITGEPTAYLAVPVIDENNTTIGVLVGTLDLFALRDIIEETHAERNPRVYHAILNTTGRIIVHTNRTYMDNMTDFSILPAGASLVAGKEGIIETYFVFEKEYRLAAFSPVPKLGWGIIVGTPLWIAYQPIEESTRAFISLIAGLLVLALLISFIIGKYITEPILRINNAIALVPSGLSKDVERNLPLQRKDEIGNLARSLLSMAGIIKSDREKVIAARNLAETARLHAEREQERAKEEKNRAELYVDLMGHDISNMHQIIIGHLELAQDLMEEKGGLKLTDKELIDTSVQMLLRSATLIENIRNIQRLRSGEVKFERLDMGDVLDEVVKAYPKSPDKDIRLDYTPVHGCYIIANTLLKDVFSNLLDNAVKHSGASVRIGITISQVNIDGRSYYMIAIEDNGPGIPDERKGIIFNRLIRGQTKAKGTGLGLYIVKTLVESFGGWVAVEDRVKGDYSKGARFIVYLPTEERVGK